MMAAAYAEKGMQTEMVGQPGPSVDDWISTYRTMGSLGHVPKEGAEFLEGIVLFAADTFASVTFSLAVGTTIEFASGLSAWEIVKSRTAMTGVNIATGRPYGWFRDKVQGWVRGGRSTGRKGFGDYAAMMIFYLPMYAMLVGAATGSWDKVKAASKGMAVFSPFTGPPFGWYLEKVRSWFGIENGQESDVQSREEYRENLHHWLSLDDV